MSKKLFHAFSHGVFIGNVSADSLSVAQEAAIEKFSGVYSPASIRVKEIQDAYGVSANGLFLGVVRAASESLALARARVVYETEAKPRAISVKLLGAEPLKQGSASRITITVPNVLIAGRSQRVKFVAVGRHQIVLAKTRGQEVLTIVKRGKRFVARDVGGVSVTGKTPSDTFAKAAARLWL
jgi:hypothetical protein